MQRWILLVMYLGCIVFLKSVLDAVDNFTNYRGMIIYSFGLSLQDYACVDLLLVYMPCYLFQNVLLWTIFYIADIGENQL